MLSALQSDLFVRTGEQSCFRESGNQRVKVIGNLPYYITQQFLEQLLPLGHLVSNAILLLQASCEPIKLV